MSEHTLKRLPITLPGSEPFEEFNKQQMKVFWLPDEINVEKDIQDILVNTTKAEKHGIITTLKLFSLYEDVAGNEWWGNNFKKMFETDNAACRMASTFSFFETSVHQPFYNKINQLLHIDNEKFYLSYQDNPILMDRMKHIDEIVATGDITSLAVFSMVEGVVLYSNFAYLKHFQSKGKNKVVSIGRGINFSLRDENIHSMAAAFAFKKKAAEAKFNAEQWEVIKSKIKSAARKLCEHEFAIIDLTFEEGAPEGITKLQMQHFVESRINKCLEQLGFRQLYEVKHNPIADWFYKGINDFTFNDFFTGIGKEYVRNWDESRFTWNTTK